MPETSLLQDELTPPAQLAALDQKDAALQATSAGDGKPTLPAPGNPGPNTDHLLQAVAIAANTLLSTQNFEDAINAALGIVGQALETDRVAVVEHFAVPSAPLPYWRVLYEWDSPGTVSQMAHPDVSEGSHDSIEAWYERLSQGQSVSYLLKEMPEPFRSGQAKLGLKALHVIPIFVDGKLWGTIGFDDCREAKRRSEVELSVLKIAADCMGSAIQRERSQQALLRAEQARVAELIQVNAALTQANTEISEREARLRESEERFRTLFELSSEGFYYAEVDPPCPIDLPVEEQCERLYQHVRVVKANPAFSAMYGVDDSDELVGLQNADVHIPNSDKNAAFIRGVVDSGYRFHNLETEEIDRQGRVRYFLNSGVGTIKEGHVVGCWATQIDITELRQTQQALLQAEQARAAELAKANKDLQQRDRLLSTVAEVTRDLLENPNVGDAIAQALQQIGEAAKISRVTLMQEQPETGSGRLQHHVIQEWAAPTVPRQTDNPSTCIMDSDDYGFLIDELRAGRSVWHTLECFPESARTQQAEIGVKSTGAVPILIEGEYFGCVGFDDCLNYRQWTAHEIDVLASGAGAIGAALHRKQLVDRLVAERIQAEQERATELEQINAQLQQSQRRLQDMLNTMSDWAWEIDANSMYTFVDEKVSKILGYQPEEMLGRSPFEFMLPDEAKRVSELFSAITAERTAFSRLENQNLAKDGRLVSFETSGTPMYDLEGNFSGYRGVDCDVTELRQMQGALLRAEQERAAELARANDALRRSVGHLTTTDNLHSFLVAVLQESIQASGAVSAGVFTYSAAAHALQMTALVLHGEVIDIASDPRAEVWRSPIPADITNAWQVMSQARRIIWINNDDPPPEHWPMAQVWHAQFGHKIIAAIPLLIGDQALGFLGLCFTTYQPENSSKLEQCWALTQHAALALQMSKLAEEAKQTGVLEERNRMASEIHDSLAQSFVGVLMQLQAANRFLSSRPDQAQACISRAQALSKEGLAEARLSVWSLCQDAECFIAETLARITEQLTTGTEIKATVTVEGTPHGLPSEVGMNLLRIAQEALTNSLRHAQAQVIQVHLTFAADTVGLRIQDDGRGFDPQQRSTGFGLVSMRQRSKQVGAQLEITTQPGAGTAIALTLPLG